VRPPGPFDHEQARSRGREFRAKRRGRSSTNKPGGDAGAPRARGPRVVRVRTPPPTFVAYRLEPEPRAPSPAHGALGARARPQTTQFDASGAVSLAPSSPDSSVSSSRP
jgi:hypothetical protein